MNVSSPIRTSRQNFRAFSLGAKVALVASAIFCVIAFAVNLNLASQQRKDSAEVNSAGRERMLSERLAHYLEVATTPSVSAENREGAISEIRRSIAQWQLNHNVVANYSAKESSAALHATVKESANVRWKLESIAREVVAKNGNIAFDEDEFRKTQLLFIQKQEGVIRELEQLHQGKVNTLERAGLIFVLLFFGLLVVEHRFIFSPLIQRVKDSFSQLEDHRDELKSMKDELETRNADLQESQIALKQAVLKSEDMARMGRFAASRFEELFTGLPIAAFTFDSKGMVFEWNREAEALFGLPAAKVLGQCITSTIALPENASEYEAMVTGVFEGEHQYNIERRTRRPNGEIRLVLFNAFPLKDPEGAINGGVCSMVDVTEQRHAEEKLKKSERRFRTMVDDLPAGAVLVEGDQIHINRYVEILTGYSRFDFHKLDDWFALIYKDQASIVREVYEADRKQGFPSSAIVPITCRDEVVRHIQFTAHRTEETEIWLLDDVTDRLASQERFRVLFDHSSDAHLLFDETGIVDCNEAAVEMLGASDKSDIIDHHPAIFSPEFQADGRRSDEKCIEMDQLARINKYHRFEWLHRKIDGTVFPVEVTLTPVELVGKETLLVVWHDLTERKAAEMKVLMAYNELNQAQSIAKIGSWQTLPSGKPIWWSEEMFTLFGFPKEDQPPSLKKMYSAVHPEDMPGLYALRQQSKEGGPGWEYELRFTRADGVERVGILTCQPMPGLRRLQGTFQDVTVARQESRRIAESESLFRTTMESMQSGVAFMDETGKLKIINPKGAEILGLTVDQVLGRDPTDATWGCIDEAGNPLQEQEYPIVQAFQSGLPIHDFVHGVRTPDGSLIWISVNAAPVFLPNNPYPIGAVSSFNDISQVRRQQEMLMGQMIKTSDQAVAMELQAMELESINEKLETLATIDGLTELKNHRSFQEFLEQQFAISKRNESPLSLLLLDVDKFKTFNDEFGHQAGDEVLRGVARAMDSRARDADFVARYGGEEFVIVLPDTDAQGALLAAEQFRQTVESCEWPHRPVTASFGVATFSANMKDRAELIAQADAALYESKHRGRNQCTHAQELDQAA